MSWQIVAGIIGPSLTILGIGLVMLRLSPPDFSAGRGCFRVAALWAMAATAFAYVTTPDKTLPGAGILVVVEGAVVALLIFGLRWMESRERLHAPTAAKNAEEAVSVTPRLVACEPRTLMIDPTDVSMGPGKPEDALMAAMLAFEYDPALPTGPRVSVRAKLFFEKLADLYQGGGRTAHVGHGYWRDTNRNWATFSPGVRHELIVAIEHRGRVTGIQDERSDRSNLRPTFAELGVLAIPSWHSVKIELILTDEATQQRLAVNTFHYVLRFFEYEMHLVKTEEQEEPSRVGKRPLIRLEIRHDDHSPQHTYVVAMNDGDAAAINVSGECAMRNGALAYTIKFGPANVGTANPTVIPMTLVTGETQLQTRGPNAPPDLPPPQCEFTTTVIQAFLGAAQGEYTGGDGRPFVGPDQPEPLACKFNVTYTDPAKTERYNRTHILRYAQGKMRIEVDQAPDPVS